ncbi:MAG: Replicative DNA helicase [Firmicutes bacterium ADurb.Bin182]|nr:MAG: Replicative DNA helicase [Firmicutes bacterium ADurb.Bin182]
MENYENNPAMQKPKAAPHSVEAEKSVLGSILISDEAMELAAESLQPSDFYAPWHQDIFNAAKSLKARGITVDTVTLTDALEQAGILDNVGGVSYITELSLFTPSAANAAHYIRIVEERSVMRQLAKAGMDIAKDAMDGDKESDSVLNDAERRIFDISMKKSADSLLPIQDTLFKSYERIGELMKLKGALTGVPTGFIDLDRVTSGLQKSDLIIVAGRPSMGKTAFALNIASYAGIRGDCNVAIFSLEMSREQLVMRMLCSEAEVDMQQVRTGQLSDSDLMKIAEALDPMNRGRIYIDDTAGISVTEIRSKCRRHKARYGLDLVVIDYLQLMQGAKKIESRQQEVSEMTRAMKLLARELNIPIILLSQLSRAPEQRTGGEQKHRPVLSDLRESGAIEQDADVVMLLYRAAVYDKNADNTSEVIIAKHRNGPTDTVELAWRGEYTKFANLAANR